MITKFHYSIQNGGDGSAYPRWFESENLAILDQDFMDEGWGECCDGYIEIAHEGPIKFLKEIKTAENVRDDLLKRLGHSYTSNLNKKFLQEHLDEVNKLIDKKNGIIALESEDEVKD